MTFNESSSNRKLRKLARRLEDTQSQLPNRLSPKKSIKDVLDDRLDKLESSVSHYLQQNQQTVADMKEYINSLNDQMEQMRRFSETSEKDHMTLVREKEEEIQGLTKLTNLNTAAIVEQIQMELRSKEADATDAIMQQERNFVSTINSYERKAQRVLMGLYNELHNEKKLRVKSIQELSGRLQQKLDQTSSLIDTEERVRSETFKKIDQMQSDVSQKLRQDFTRIVRDRKQSNQAMLRLLQNACDNILY